MTNPDESDELDVLTDAMTTEIDAFKEKHERLPNEEELRVIVEKVNNG